jgi:hypothetical protein
MPENYVLLERTELNADAASVTFANIPQSGYTDLKIVMSVRDTYAAVSAALFVGFNGSTSSLSSKYLQGSGSSAVSGNLTSLALAGLNTGANATANTFSNIELYIPNYTSSNFKSYSADSVTENNATEAYTNLIAGLWSNTAAITSMTFTCGTAFTAGSTFSLYGIAALGTTPAIAPKAYGGNRIDNDGTYWYHTFTSSGTFTPQVGLTADVLQIAGGGGTNQGGGGGAGGFLGFTAQTLAVQNYTATVGAGGAASSNGANSQFGSLTASVGGGRGGANSTSDPAGNGGSGGGSMGNTSVPYGALAGGTGTSGQGNNGGSGLWGPLGYSGGGGGGAGAVGANSSGNNGAAGGAGLSTYSSWASATSTGVSGFYAGGGGGAGGLAGTSGSAGAGGSGGGGAGNASDTFGTVGTANTGGGAGGSDGVAGVAGGSGIIIVRYPIA